MQSQTKNTLRHKKNKNSFTNNVNNESKKKVKKVQSSAKCTKKKKSKLQSNKLLSAISIDFNNVGETKTSNSIYKSI